MIITACLAFVVPHAKKSCATVFDVPFSLGGTVQLSGLMGDTAKRAVESTNVPQLMTTLRGRVELAEERLTNMADKSFRALEDELAGARAEVH